MNFLISELLNHDVSTSFHISGTVSVPIVVIIHRPRFQTRVMACTNNAREGMEARRPTRSSPKRDPSQQEEEAMTTGPPAQEIEITGTQAPQGGSSGVFFPDPATDEPGPQPGVGQAMEAHEEGECQASSATSTPGAMFRTCPSCCRGNQLATSDEHQECMSCLGFGHLMATCSACQALSSRDRLERAR